MALDPGTLVAKVGLEQSDLEGGFGAIKSNLPKGLGIVGGVAGGAPAIALTARFVDAVSIDKCNDKLPAQPGRAQKEPERAAAAVGVYAYTNAFGDSKEEMQAVTAGVVSSIHCMRDASVDELQGILEKVSSISGLFEIESDCTSQVVSQILSSEHPRSLRPPVTDLVEIPSALEGRGRA